MRVSFDEGGAAGDAPIALLRRFGRRGQCGQQHRGGDAQARNGCSKWLVRSWIILRIELAPLCVVKPYAGSSGRFIRGAGFDATESLGWNYGGGLT
jgi:hypothetical protein